MVLPSLIYSDNTNGHVSTTNAREPGIELLQNHLPLQPVDKPAPSHSN